MTTKFVIDFVIILLIFLRILSAFVTAPFFGDKSIPVIIKIFLAFIIAYIIFLVSENSNIHVETSIWWLFINAAKEIITGLIIGYSLNFVFYGISFAGSLIGFDMGLSIATVFNPFDESQSEIIGQTIFLGAIIVFILINGHHYLISGLLYSFKVIPIGKLVISKSVYTLLIKYSANIFVIAIKISAPILISFFLINIAEGILARAIPQMQIFFVTQPLLIGIGFSLLVITTPFIIFLIKNLLESFEVNLMQLMKAMGT